MACFEGCFEGKEIDFEQLVPEHQKEFAKKFFENFLTPQLEQFALGRGATPFKGPLTAPAFNPFTQGAMGLMAKSPYAGMGNWGQMPAFGTAPDYPGATGWGGEDGDGEDDEEIVIGTTEIEEIKDEDDENGNGDGDEESEEERKRREEEEKRRRVIGAQHGFHGTVTGPKTFQVEPGVRERVDFSPMGSGQNLPQLFSLIQRLSQLPQRPPMGQMPGMQQMGMPGRKSTQMPMPMQSPPRRPLMQQPRLPFMRQ